MCIVVGCMFVKCKVLYSTKKTKVYLAKNTTTNELLVVKKYRRKYISCYDHIENERNIHSQLHHENIIRFIHTYNTNKSVCFMFEYAEKGDLFEMLYSQNVKLDYPVLLKVLYSLAKAIEYLHELDIVHNDIKPENIAIRGNGTLALLDFGLSFQVCANGQKVTTYTPVYISPEVKEGSRLDDPKKIDVWCFGLLTFELITKISPDHLRKNKDMVKHIKFKELRHIVTDCTHHDPYLRPDISTIVERLQRLLYYLECE